MRLDPIVQRLAARTAEYDAAAAAAKREAAALESAERYAAAAATAQKALQTVAATLQNQAHKQIAKVVTRCIRQCGWDYEFHIEFSRKRGKTEADMYFSRDGHRVDPRYAAGGGVVDMAALALRLAALILSTPKRRPILVLDEPFRGVNGEEHRRRAARLIETLAREMRVQFIIATGHEWLRIGKVYDL